jgi:hypothetical protein
MFYFNRLDRYGWQSICLLQLCPSFHSVLFSWKLDVLSKRKDEREHSQSLRALEEREKENRNQYTGCQRSAGGR